MAEFIQAEKLITFLVMLSVLIVLHELGHYIVARRNGVRVNEFAVGFGPKLAKVVDKNGTVWALNLLPIGGYCAMQGEDGKNTEAEQQREFRAGSARYSDDNFQAKAAWQRLAIVVAGPFANFILAFVILLASATIFGVQGDRSQAVVGPLITGMPAQRAGLRPGDRVVSVDGVTIRDGQQLVDLIHNSGGKPLRIVYVRNGIASSVTVAAIVGRCNDPKHPHYACIGFTPVPAFQRVGPGEALLDAATGMGRLWDQTVGSLALLVAHPREYGSQVRGIVGMEQVATVTQDFGGGLYLQLAALISFSLGIFNLLPIPALDGGRAAFILAEMLRGKPVDPEKEALVHIAGFAVLMLVMVAVTFHDISNIVSGKGVF
ncbi:MAG: site-2 protease family protein [Candidatus Eremiobacteraeota bacterium]|nr:site-2 protease family protein [Candidatus Eremiobacteraeota bacterium]